MNKIIQGKVHEQYVKNSNTSMMMGLNRVQSDLSQVKHEFDQKENTVIEKDEEAANLQKLLYPNSNND